MRPLEDIFYQRQPRSRQVAEGNDFAPQYQEHTEPTIWKTTWRWNPTSGIWHTSDSQHRMINLEKQKHAINSYRFLRDQLMKLQLINLCSSCISLLPRCNSSSLEYSSPSGSNGGLISRLKIWVKISPALWLRLVGFVVETMKHLPARIKDGVAYYAAFRHILEMSSHVMCKKSKKADKTKT